MKRGHCALILCITPVMLWAPTPASATKLQVSFCNHTPNAVDVAVGYDRTGDNETRSEGWWEVQPCRCTVVFNEDVKTFEWWVYVKKTNGGIEDALTSGNGAVCVRPAAFTLRRANTSERDCKLLGGKWVNFQRVVAKSSPHKLNFGRGANCM